MAAKRFKVRRNALFMKAACFIGGIVEADYGINTKSGSVSTFSGGLTAASTFTVSGSAIVGSGGTALAGLLCGSGTISVASLTSGCAVTQSLAVTGLTQSHKVFLSASDLNPDLTLGSISCSPGGGVMLIGVKNTGSTTNASGVEYLSYLAVLDK